MSRETRQRQAIRQALEQSPRPMSPTEILASAGDTCPGLGLATVYRTIKTLSSEGDIVRVELPGDATRYTTPGRNAQTHFRCDRCKQVLPVNTNGRPPRFELPDGFLVDGYELLVRGRCASCASGSPLQ